METEISKERSWRGKETRDKESGGQFHLISEFPFTFFCMYIIIEGKQWLNRERETSWLKLDKPFFTVCWFFISSLCEAGGGCFCATSQNSWRCTCTFRTSWYLKAHQPFWIGPSFFLQTTHFFRNKWAVYSGSHDSLIWQSFRFAKQT